MRLLRILALLPVISCGPTQTQTNDIHLAVRPTPLWDDGAIATLVVTVSDLYGQPGAGHVHVVSSAGSLTKGLTLTLDPLGVASAQLTCIAVEDPMCTGTVNVTATWVDG